MKFLFTKNDLPGSKLIRWGLGHDCSHMAIQFDAPEAVYESRLETGCGGGGLEDFLKRNTVVHALELISPNEFFERALFNSIVKNAGQCRYDTRAIAFWAVAALGKRLLGLRLPQKNPWGRRGEHYCVEIIRGSERILDEHLGTGFRYLDVEMMAPHDAYCLLKHSYKLRPVAAPILA